MPATPPLLSSLSPSSPDSASAVAVPLHQTPSPGALLVGVVALAALGAAVLLGLGLAALARRRSQPYLLVVLALAALLGRSLVAALGVAAVLPTTDHHVAEHGLDVAMAALVIAAVYYARGVEERARRRLGGRTDGGWRGGNRGRGPSEGGRRDDSEGGRRDDIKGGRRDDSEGGRRDDIKGGRRDDSEGGRRDDSEGGRGDGEDGGRNADTTDGSSGDVPERGGDDG